MKIGFSNVRSLIPHLNDIESSVTENLFDIFLICESWLKKEVNDEQISIKGYSLYRADRNANGRGLCIYIKNTIHCEIIRNTNEYIWEQLWIKVKIKKKSFAIGVIYKPHEQNTNNFLDEFENTLMTIVPVYDEIVCMGDFNFDFLDKENNLTKKFVSIIESLNLQQIIEEPTRIARTSATLLDFIILGNMTDVEKGIIHNSYSDHAAIFCKIKNDVRNQPKLVTYRKFKNFDEELFREDLFSIAFFKIYDQENINAKVAFLVNCLTGLFDRHAPIVTSRVTKPKAPWLTDVIKIMMHERDAALKKYNKCKTQSSYQFYKEMRNYTTKAIEREQKAYFNHQFNTKSPKELWRCLKRNKIISEKSREIPSDLNNADDLNDFFVNSIPILQPPEETLNFYKKNKAVNSNFCFSEVNDLFVYETICSIKTNATGCDFLNSKLLRLCCPHIVPYITHIINHCLNESVVPDLWKRAVISVLPKKQNPKEHKDLRAVSILPFLSKILERAMEIQIRDHINNYSLIPDVQSGFRKGYSCATALLHIVDDIFRATDDGMCTLLVMLDFSRAFDTLNHELLIHILSYIGFSENASLMINNFIKNREQAVRLVNSVSTFRKLKAGVPQGSILGPLLFSIYISRLLEHVNHCKIHFYADDTQLYYSFAPGMIGNACRLINNDLNDFVKAASDHCLQINSRKTNVMLFGSKINQYRMMNEVHLKIDSESLEVVSEAKNLGIILSTDLRFEKHIDSLIQRAFVTIKLLYGNRRLLSTNIKKTLCDALILSIFNYGDVIYGPNLTSQYRQKIQKVQNSCLRLIYGIRRNQRISYKLQEAGWLNMGNRRSLHSAILYHKIITFKTPPYLFRKLSFRTDVHNLNIRYKGTLSPPSFRTETYRRSFSYDVCKVYNALPSNIKMKNLVSFKKSLKVTLTNSQDQL